MVRDSLFISGRDLTFSPEGLLFKSFCQLYFVSFTTSKDVTRGLDSHDKAVFANH